MATASTAAQRRDVKEFIFVWEGLDRNNRQVRGEMRGASETVVTTNLPVVPVEAFPDEGEFLDVPALRSGGGGCHVLSS